MRDSLTHVLAMNRAIGDEFSLSISWSARSAADVLAKGSALEAACCP